MNGQTKTICTFSLCGILEKALRGKKWRESLAALVVMVLLHQLNQKSRLRAGQRKANTSSLGVDVRLGCDLWIPPIANNLLVLLSCIHYYDGPCCYCLLLLLLLHCIRLARLSA